MTRRPVEAGRAPTVERVSCNACPFSIVDTPYQIGAIAAWNHQANNPGHRASLWEEPTAQYPREVWEGYAARQLEAAVADARGRLGLDG